MNFQELALASVFLPSNNNDAPPGAWLGHIPFASWIVEAVKPNILVELGTHYGDSFFAFCQAVQFNRLTTQCYAVDTWQGDEHAGEYGSEVYEFVQRKQQSDFPSIASLLRMTFDDALAHFSDGTVDMLHIDGLHTYEAVKHDFETWQPKLSDRAVVLFHDTAVRRGDFGVWRFWEELAAQYPHIRFDHSNGLGVLFVGKNRPPILENLLSAWQDDNQATLIKQFFATMGERHEKDRRIVTLEADGRARHQILEATQEHANNMQQHISNLEAHAGKLQQHIQEVEQRAAEFEQRAAQFEQRAAYLEQHAAAVERHATELEQLAAEREQRLAQQAQLIDTLEQHAVQQDQHIKTLEHHLQEQCAHSERVESPVGRGVELHFLARDFGPSENGRPYSPLRVYPQ